ncbi:LicD family protein [Pilosibacter fragilis]|uniref:LicD family protein n=1 Tax=Pilosibacter fragilis TaxID=3078042 RepID=UPI0032D2AEC1
MERELITLTEEDLKQLQNKSLEMAKYVVNFCKERNIRVFFFAGSLLGAVRHNGFIPWDDDIDMNFPAPDFERFVEAWEKEADKERYSLCLQTKNYNDHTLSGSIRDNNTTFITDSTVDLDVNQGLAIDIEPLHACPKTKLGQKLQLILAAGRSLFKAGRVPARQSSGIKTASKILLGIFKSTGSRYFIWHTLEKWATTTDRKYEDAEYVREFTMFPFITWLYPRKWYDSTEWVRFEDTEVPIPVGAREYLTKRYGNYMELPPEKDRRPEHRIVFMDLDTPYKEYRGEKYFVEGAKK